MSTLDDLLDKFNKLPEEHRKEIEQKALSATKNMLFLPNPGPQTEAYISKADILLYGGSAGSGKSMVELGLAVNEHQRSIIFRRESSQTDGLEADGKKIIGESARYNGVDKEWSWPDGRSLKLAGMKEADDWMKHAGRERDLIAFDEAAEFLESQVSSLMAWNRGPVGQRCRVVLASNPPRSDEGLWIVEWFAPWLSPSFHNPAPPGELRWAVMLNGKTTWVDGPEKKIIDGEEYTPHSRTFIPGFLKDNPFRNTDEYRTKLQSLPEPLRSQLLHGDFAVGIRDAEKQLIPTAWIIAAQNRWTERPPAGVAMTAMGFDPAGGGQDSAELAMRYGGWYAPLISAQGEETADGSASAAKIVKHRRDSCVVVVDKGGGYGGSVMMRLRDNGIDAMAFDGAAKSTAKTKDGQYSFANKRSEAWWKFMEELDPDQEGGSVIALPPDPELRADLTAPRWDLTSRGIQVEPKIVTKDGKVVGGIRKRLGRSSGKGDAAVYCMSPGNRAIVRARSNSGQRPQVILGHQDKRNHIRRKV